MAPLTGEAMNVLCGQVADVHLESGLRVWSQDEDRRQSQLPTCANCGEIGHPANFRGCRIQPSRVTNGTGMLPDTSDVSLEADPSNANVINAGTDEDSGDVKEDTSNDLFIVSSESNTAPQYTHDTDSSEDEDTGDTTEEATNDEGDPIVSDSDNADANTRYPDVLVTRFPYPSSHLKALKSKLGKDIHCVSDVKGWGLQFSPENELEYQTLIEYLDSIEGTPGLTKYIICRVKDQGQIPRGPLPQRIVELRRRKNRALKLYSLYAFEEHKKKLKELSVECKEKVGAFRAKEREDYPYPY